MADDLILDLHPSMLGNAADCELRAVGDRARVSASWRDLFLRRGFVIDSIMQNAGAAVGSGFHEGAAHLLRARMTDSEPKMDEAIELGWEKLKLETKDGMLPDSITANRDEAGKQMTSILQVWYGMEGYKIYPTEVETRHEVTIGPGWKMVGTMDWHDLVRLDDNKSGKKHSAHQLQLGGYVVLALSFRFLPETLTHTWTQRVAVGAPPARPIVVPYNTEVAKKTAIAASKRLMAATEEFKKTGDPLAFSANPMSMLCSDKYCNLFGGDICQMWKIKKLIKESKR